VAIARGGLNLRIRSAPGALRAHLDGTPTASPFSPSVDVLFESAAAVVGSAVLGVVLTGMGNDGVEGARALVSRGSRVLTESESSCVVYGMPRAVVEAGLSAGEAPLERMVDKILDSL
jgi:two-component system chemotaxis response regulator CheB